MASPAQIALSSRARFLGGIHMTPIPSLPYELLYHERMIRDAIRDAAVLRTCGRLTSQSR